MAEAKPLASLSSSLLARKGQARPAMRPQGFAGFPNPMGGHEDLGWNDMGHEIPRPLHIHADEHLNGFVPEVPEVMRQREILEAEFGAPQDMDLPHPVTEFEAFEAPTTMPGQEIHPKAKAQVAKALPAAPRPLPTVAIARAKKAAKGRKTKAAFTLRMDPERHLKLRLACAITRDSAQAIVTEALDNYLSSFPEIDELVRKVPAGV
ncbi:hypothetical protein [Sphingobium boeckii]|uniref:Uncharacterized protein n=1 Tax=Sphingobium boeckii TaxID=1082345 RepID=A0A7W9AL38_9SPHN|nr:hypothetical protein [Sphingobium boeckii]MBB5687466.1 hypothetical protein [Sphingobium boeckii]